jgi:hypothetical protein
VIAQGFARLAGVRSRRLVDGGLATYYQNQPDNVYLAYPHVNFKIQIFDPSAKQARGLVVTGRIRPVR